MAAKAHSDSIELAEYSYSRDLPERIKNEIEASLAIDQADARAAGQLGFVARALVQATMPYKDPKTDVFTRKNGEMTLKIMTAAGGGVPFGIYPRLLLSWVTTEAVRTKSPQIVLGESLGRFLKGLNIQRGSANERFLMQTQRLFSSHINVMRKSTQKRPGFEVRNIAVVSSARVTDIDAVTCWQPQDIEDAGRWQSRLELTNEFFKEITDSPVPIDLRAYVALKGSPMAMDIYSWLTYRMSYLRGPTKPIPWELLQMQFGANFPFDSQGLRNFKKAFILALKHVAIVYPEAKVQVEDKGLGLLPSPTHVPQKSLF